MDMADPHPSAPVNFASALRATLSKTSKPVVDSLTPGKTTTRRFASLRGSHETSRLKKQSTYAAIVIPTKQDELGTMIDATGPKSRRERTLIGTECAACEEPLEHTLRGERILQLSCGHVAHEACFYEFIKEFETQECPSCNAPLALDTSRGGNLNFGTTFDRLLLPLPCSFPSCFAPSLCLPRSFLCLFRSLPCTDSVLQKSSTSSSTTVAQTTLICEIVPTTRTTPPILGTTNRVTPSSQSPTPNSHRPTTFSRRTATNHSHRLAVPNLSHRPTAIILSNRRTFSNRHRTATNHHSRRLTINPRLTFSNLIHHHTLSPRRLHPTINPSNHRLASTKPRFQPPSTTLARVRQLSRAPLTTTPTAPPRTTRTTLTTRKTHTTRTALPSNLGRWNPDNSMDETTAS
jgi:hypothetical protein